MHHASVLFAEKREAVGELECNERINFPRGPNLPCLKDVAVFSQLPL